MQNPPWTRWPHNQWIFFFFTVRNYHLLAWLHTLKYFWLLWVVALTHHFWHLQRGVENAFFKFSCVSGAPLCLLYIVDQICLLNLTRFLNYFSDWHPLGSLNLYAIMMKFWNVLLQGKLNHYAQVIFCSKWNLNCCIIKHMDYLLNGNLM